jgi:hypothetical protein
MQLQRDQVELWVRHHYAPDELEDLIFETDPDWYYCLQTDIPACEFGDDFETGIRNLIRRFGRCSWKLDGQVCSLNHGDLIIVPGSQAGLIYAVYNQLLDFRRMKHFSCKLGMYWACLDLGRFLGRRYDNPCRMEAPELVLESAVVAGQVKGFPGL